MPYLFCTSDMENSTKFLFSCNLDMNVSMMPFWFSKASSRNWYLHMGKTKIENVICNTMFCFSCLPDLPDDVLSHLCSLCSSSWQSLQVKVSHVSQKSLRASCLCTGQKTGRWPDVPTDSTKHTTTMWNSCSASRSSPLSHMPYVFTHPLPNSNAG